MTRKIKDQERIIELRNQGLTRRQIAETLGIKQNALNQRMKSMLKRQILSPIPSDEIKRRSQSVHSVMTDEQVAQAKVLREQGLSLRAIASQFNVCQGTVCLKVGKIQRITPLQRQLIDLRLRGLTIDEVAAELKKSRGTVGVLLARLVKRGLIPKGIKQKNHSLQE